MRPLEVRRRAPGATLFRVIFWWTFIQFLVYLVLRLLYRIRLEGAEHVPPTGPLIFASNHQSNLDPMLVGVLTHDRPFSGVARTGLFRFPLGLIMRSIGAVPIQRDRGDTGAIRAALAELQAGRCLMIYPEGTRTPDGAVGPFKPGVMLLLKHARAAGVRIVPIAMEGAYDVWPIGRRFPRLTGRIMLKAAPALDGGDLLSQGPRAGLDHLRDLIEAMRVELRAKIRAATRGRLPRPGPGDRSRLKHDDSAPAPSPGEPMEFSR